MIKIDQVIDNARLIKMHTGATRKDQFMAYETVASAEISGRLFNAKKSAFLLSLSAKNLSVIAARIGDDAAGLKVLSLFYDQFAQKAIKSVGDINDLAFSMAKNAMIRWRRQIFMEKMEWVLQENACTSLMLQNHYAVSVKKQFDMHHDSQVSCDKLALLLLDVLGYMKTMQIIAVNARIEACMLNSHYLQLTQLSQSIDTYTAAVIDDIQYCEQRIKGLLSL